MQLRWNEGRAGSPPRRGVVGAAWSIAAFALILAGCARSDREAAAPPAASPPPPTANRYNVPASPRVVEGGRIHKGGGTYKIGNPYQIAGRWYVPRVDPHYNAAGIASWYGADFHGRKTANGEIYDMNGLTAAHPTLPLPTRVLVTNLENGRTILLRVNDRGPYAHDRLIDLSREAARRLGFERQGLARVQVRFAGHAPLDGNDEQERRHLAAQPWARFAEPARPAMLPGRASLGH